MEYTLQGVKLVQGKIKAMLNWPTLTNISELRWFLGLGDYYRKFFRHIGSIPYQSVKTGQFGWTKEAKTAFQVLKQAIISVESDASEDRIGGWKKNTIFVIVNAQVHR